MSLSSLDTNLLLYAANEDACEHIVCKAFLQKVIEEPSAWIIADQVFLNFTAHFDSIVVAKKNAPFLFFLACPQTYGV
jgi:predicted nucleic acid-binding protein